MIQLEGGGLLFRSSSFVPLFPSFLHSLSLGEYVTSGVFFSVMMWYSRGRDRTDAAGKRERKEEGQQKQEKLEEEKNMYVEKEGRRGLEGEKEEQRQKMENSKTNRRGRKRREMTSTPKQTEGRKEHKEVVDDG